MSLPGFCRSVSRRSFSLLLGHWRLEKSERNKNVKQPKATPTASAARKMIDVHAAVGYIFCELL